MKIGIAAPIGVGTFRRYFDDNASRTVLELNDRISAASAIGALVHSLVAEGYFVRLFTLAKTNFHIKSANLEIVGVQQDNGYLIKNTFGVFVDANNLRKSINKSFSDLDVIHAHWTYEYAYATRVFSNDIPVFCTVRDYAFFIWRIESVKNKFKWTFKLLMNKLVFNSKKIHFIANSPYTQDIIKKHYERIVPMIPNPIKEDFLIATASHVKGNSLSLLCISSSLDERKNIETLLAAFKMFVSKYPVATLQLVGKPFTDNNPTIAKWKQKGLLQNVTLVGAVNNDELHTYYDASDIFINPSIEETFGNTLLEAMARRIPILAGNRSGAVPFVLQQGKAGLLCDVTSAESINDGLYKIYSDYEQAKERTEWAFNFLYENYRGHIVVQKHIDLYKDALKSKK